MSKTATKPSSRVKTSCRSRERWYGATTFTKANLASSATSVAIMFFPTKLCVAPAVKCSGGFTGTTEVKSP